MNQSAMLARFVREADVDCVLLAGRYSLLDQGGLDELLPLCVERGVAVIAAGVFNSGLLATPEPGATFDYEPAPPALVARAQQLSALCEEYQIPLRAAALQFPLAHPAVLTVLSGARSAAEIEENATLFAQPIPSALWDRLRREGFIRDDAPTP
jgi:D-threo-aldose 1-dehydrogenase